MGAHTPPENGTSPQEPVAYVQAHQVKRYLPVSPDHQAKVLEGYTAPPEPRWPGAAVTSVVHGEGVPPVGPLVGFAYPAGASGSSYHGAPAAAPLPPGAFPPPSGAPLLPAPLSEHPSAWSLLGLGVASFFIPLLAFFTWFRTEALLGDIRYSGAPYNTEGPLRAARTLAIVSSLWQLLVLAGLTFLLQLYLAPS